MPKFSAKKEDIFLSQNNSLIQSNIDAMNDGVALLSRLQPEQYTQGYKPAFHSTIGAHFRHVLEHYRCFMTQLESGQFCYDSRQRDQLLECDFEYANRAIIEVTCLLGELESKDLNRQCQLSDRQVIGTVASTVFRELLFLQSHTMHHYAIIGAMTRALGAQPADDFGVAIATREHQQSSTEALSGDSPTCAQ